MVELAWNHAARMNKPQVKAAARIKFRDINCDYLMDTTQSQLILDNDLAVRNHLKNLLSTPLGTEEFEPTFGSNLPFRIMEPINKFTAFLLETDTMIAIFNWMSDRIKIVTPGATIIPLTDQDGYVINLPYVNIETGSTVLFTFQVLR